jgi:hypothetical protein
LDFLVIIVYFFFVKNFAILLAGLAVFLFAGEDKAQNVSSQGREFWLMYLQNWTISFEYLFISGKPDIEVEIPQPNYGTRPWHGKFKLNSSFFSNIAAAIFNLGSVNSNIPSVSVHKAIAIDYIAIANRNIGNVTAYKGFVTVLVGLVDEVLGFVY